MRLIRPPGAFTKVPGGTPFIGPGAHRRSEWLKEWLANKPRNVVLSCGHHEDLSIPGLIILKAFGEKKVDVLCERCNAFATVIRHLKPKVRETPSEPLF